MIWEKTNLSNVYTTIGIQYHVRINVQLWMNKCHILFSRFFSLYLHQASWCTLWTTAWLPSFSLRVDAAPPCPKWQWHYAALITTSFCSGKMRERQALFAFNRSIMWTLWRPLIRSANESRTQKCHKNPANSTLPLHFLSVEPVRRKTLRSSEANVPPFCAVGLKFLAASTSIFGITLPHPVSRYSILWFWTKISGCLDFDLFDHFNFRFSDTRFSVFDLRFWDFWLYLYDFTYCFLKFEFIFDFSWHIWIFDLIF